MPPVSRSGLLSAKVLESSSKWPDPALWKLGLPVLIGQQGL